MIDKKTEAELEADALDAVARYEWRYQPNYDRAQQKAAIEAYIDHLKASRREYAKKAFEDGQKRLFVVVTEHDSETRTVQTSRPQTFHDWEAEQEEGK